MSKNSDDKKKDLTDEQILAMLKEFYDVSKQYYARDERRMRMLDMTDNGDRWKAIGAEFPPYQILADTNFVSYVKSNLLASLYTTAKSAEILPTSEDDKELCTKLNLFLNNFWAIENVAFKQFQAGERAALLNLGLTQVGWDENYYTGEKGSKGRVVIKNIDPMNFRRDVFASSLQEGNWCCKFDRLHKSVIKKDSKYKEKFENWLKSTQGVGSQEAIPSYNRPHEAAVDKDHYNLFVWWVRNCDGGIDEYHTIDTSVILYRREDIKPSLFPIAELYCNLPGRGLVGISEPAKVFTNDTAYSFMVSLYLTSEYKNQRPPKFVSAQSGLNIPAFTKHGAEADRTFVVQQDASKAVHYQQFPVMSAQLPNILQTLQANIQDTSGVDGRYTGRDTGSIITTGGTEEMLNRATMIDTPKIVNYEKYTRDLTELILKYMIEFSPKRKYFIKKENQNEYESVEIDFPEIDTNTLFNYEISISSELPKNKQRIAAWADMIMEKQMQYREGGGNVELLTEEEWLMLQDIPFKELMLERMGFQRDTNVIKQTTQVLYQYANLLEQGMSPDEAMLATADTLGRTQKGLPLGDSEQMLTSGPMTDQAPFPAMNPSMLTGGVDLDPTALMGEQPMM